jgi:hypothetical protein
MKQVNSNPTSNAGITVTTYAFSATGASGTVTGTGVSALKTGQSIILGLNGATAQGYTKNGEYFVIPVNGTTFKIASTKAKAMAGTYLSTASGNAGAGTIYPNIEVGGVLFAGTGGNANLRGFSVCDTGLTSFSIHKNIPDGSVLPFMVKDICASGTTASDLISWSN